MEDSRLPKIMLNHIFENNGSEWIDSMQDGCSDLSFHLSSIRMLDIDLCKSLLMDKFKRKWAIQSSNKPKLMSYVKQHCFTENYVNVNLSCDQRLLLALLHCGTLLLKIENGGLREHQKNTVTVTSIVVNK